MMVLLVWLGIYPQTVFNTFRPAMNRLQQYANTKPEPASSGARSGFCGPPPALVPDRQEMNDERDRPVGTIAAVVTRRNVGGLVMVAIAVRRNHRPHPGLTLIGLAASFISLWVVAPLTPRQVTPAADPGRYALFYIGLTIAATFAVALLSFGYLEIQRCRPRGVLRSAAGGGARFVGLGGQQPLRLLLSGVGDSQCQFVCVERLFSNPRPSLEAGIKYLILAASSAAFLLFGMALIYSQIGSMSFERSRVFAERRKFRTGRSADGDSTDDYRLRVQTGPRAVPPLDTGHLQTWRPSAAFVATVSKGAMFALLSAISTTQGLTRWAQFLSSSPLSPLPR